MPFGQREKIVFYFVGSPIIGKQIVAFQAFRRKACLLVIRVDGGIKIIPVTTDTIISYPVELQCRSGSMAFLTTNSSMNACQGESIFLVQGGDIID